jgi:hypothetical protein
MFSNCPTTWKTMLKNPLHWRTTDEFPDPLYQARSKKTDMKYLLTACLLLMGFLEQTHAQEKHPHILVNTQDRTIILNKIFKKLWFSQNPWKSQSKL